MQIENSRDVVLNPIAFVYLVAGNQPLVTQTLGDEISIGTDGYVDELGPGDYTIMVYPRSWPKQSFVAFELEAGHKAKKINLTEITFDNESTGTKVALDGFFQKTVNIRPNQKGINRSHHPKNNICVVKYTGRGKGEIWQVSLIGQDGKFYLVKEKVEDFKFYLKGGQIFSPDLPDWSGLNELVLQGLTETENDKDLEDISSREEKKAYFIKFKEENIGIVTEWNSAQGNGLIQMAEGKALVTWRDLEPRTENGRKYLVIGETVKVDKIQKLPETNSSNRKFNLVASGVSLLKEKN